MCVVVCGEYMFEERVVNSREECVCARYGVSHIRGATFLVVFLTGYLCGCLLGAETASFTKL